MQQDRQGYDLIIQLLTYSLINGVLSAAVSITGLYIITVLFNLPTGMRMIELSQPNHPLLQKLLRQAPGTYQHSLQVANLAEQATSAIGGNAELVRVAALYHDIGKSVTPYFSLKIKWKRATHMIRWQTPIAVRTSSLRMCRREKNLPVSTVCLHEFEISSVSITARRG
ncbi:MAG UNVERIFIED_CONTAM: HDIG domain-containing protein [Anaerolineae bacterium]